MRSTINWFSFKLFIVSSQKMRKMNSSARKSGCVSFYKRTLTIVFPIISTFVSYYFNFKKFIFGFTPGWMDRKYEEMSNLLPIYYIYPCTYSRVRTIGWSRQIKPEFGRDRLDVKKHYIVSFKLYRIFYCWSYLLYFFAIFVRFIQIEIDKIILIAT